MPLVITVGRKYERWVSRRVGGVVTDVHDGTWEVLCFVPDTHTAQERALCCCDRGRLRVFSLNNCDLTFRPAAPDEVTGQPPGPAVPDYTPPPERVAGWPVQGKHG